MTHVGARFVSATGSTVMVMLVPLIVALPNAPNEQDRMSFDMLGGATVTVSVAMSPDVLVPQTVMMLAVLDSVTLNVQPVDELGANFAPPPIELLQIIPPTTYALLVPAIFWTALAGGILLKGPLILVFVVLTIATLAILDRSAAWLWRLRFVSGWHGA
jgi:hypothetical protein